MNEFRLIKYLTENVQKRGKNIVEGIGDDAAVLEYNKNEFLLLTIDSIVEGVHFDTEWRLSRKNLFTSIGWKSVAVNVSDIFAMGGKPSVLLVSLSVPQHIKSALLKFLYKGIDECAKFYGISVVGGNVTSNRYSLVIDIAALGIVKKERLLLRRKASAKDYIYVQGNIGNSAAGLYLLNKGKKIAKYIGANIRPVPTALSDTLFKRYRINAAIDISDGLVGDLYHILENSNKSAEIYLEWLPVDNEVKKLFPEKWKEFAMYGGEEYKIIFTSPDEIDMINITKIGKIVNGRKKIYLISGGKKKRIRNHSGFVHFK